MKALMILIDFLKNSLFFKTKLCLRCVCFVLLAFNDLASPKAGQFCVNLFTLHCGCNELMVILAMCINTAPP